MDEFGVGEEVEDVGYHEADHGGFVEEDRLAMEGLVGAEGCFDGAFVLVCPVVEGLCGEGGGVFPEWCAVEGACVPGVHFWVPEVEGFCWKGGDVFVAGDGFGEFGGAASCAADKKDRIFDFVFGECGKIACEIGCVVGKF